MNGNTHAYSLQCYSAEVYALHTVHTVLKYTVLKLRVTQVTYESMTTQMTTKCIMIKQKVKTKRKLARDLKNLCILPEN